jgi:hypothetical protein
MINQKYAFILGVFIIEWFCVFCAFAENQNTLDVETITITVGSEQNMLSNIRSEGLDIFIQNIGANTREIGDNGQDLWFGHSFTNLIKEDMLIINASLSLSLEAVDGTTDMGYNDRLLLGFFDSKGNLLCDLWGQRIGTDPPFEGLLNYRWESGLKETIQLDLESLPFTGEKQSDIFTYMNRYGFLDVMIEDDTKVNELRLTMMYANKPLSIAINDISGYQDEMIRIPLYLYNPEKTDIIAIDIAFDFDETLLSDAENAFTLDNGELVSYDYQTEYNPQYHMLTIYDTRQNYFSESGIIGYLQLNVCGHEGQQATISTSFLRINREPVGGESGVVTILKGNPEISPISPQTIYEDTASEPMSFTVSDIRTPDELTVSALSSNATIIPNDPDHLIITHTDNNWTITLIPAENQFGSITIELTVEDADHLTASTLLNVDILPVNDAPDFLVGADFEQKAGISHVVMENFLTQICMGPDNESSQNILRIDVNTLQPELFSGLPEITTDGTLSFTPAINSIGNATITVQLIDDGGTLHQGKNTSLLKTFTITFKGFRYYGNVMYYASQKRNVPEVDVFLTNGQQTCQTRTDSNGFFEFVNMQGGNYTLSFSKNNDLNGITGLDATLMAKYVVKSSDPDCYTMLAADLFRDGYISGVNAAFTAQYSVGLIECLTDQCEHWVFAPYTFPDCDNHAQIPYPYHHQIILDKDQNELFRAIRVGDLTGNWQLDDNDQKRMTKKRSVEKLHIDVPQNDGFTIPIKIDESVLIKAVDIKLSYDKNLMKYSGIKLSDPMKGYQYIVNANINGELAIVVYSEKNEFVNGPAEILSINFVATGDVDSIGSIDMSQCDCNESYADGGFLINSQIAQAVNVEINNYVWELRSLPVIPEQSDIFSLFPLAKEAYRYVRGTYIRVTQLEPGIGYFIKKPKDSILQANGVNFKEFTVHLKPGWHLLGAVDGTYLPVVEPSGAIETMYAYTNGQYIETQNFQKGQGYWVYVEKACVFRLGLAD